jgi:hypothetical protein
MAAICPIAALAVLPLAIPNGDVFGMSATGWTSMLILTFLSGVAANGLLVFAQKSIQIGTIAVAQVGYRSRRLPRARVLPLPLLSAEDGYAS